MELKQLMIWTYKVYLGVSFNKGGAMRVLEPPIATDFVSTIYRYNQANIFIG